MACFKRIELLGDLGEMKINLDNIISVSYYTDLQQNKKVVSIICRNGSVTDLVEGVHILDAEAVFNKFPS